jgi:ataxia telangiectasia mutated family protein
MATRRSLIAASRSREAPQVFGDLHTPRLTLLNTLDVKALLRTGQLARAEGNIQASINALVAATKLDTSTEIESEAVQDEFAQVLWAQNEHMLAIQHVDERVKRVRKAGNAGGRLAVLLGQMVRADRSQWGEPS